MAFNELFRGIAAGQFPAPAEGVVCLLAQTPLLEAVKLMAAKNISSCPVRDGSKPQAATWLEKYICFVDVVDITFHILAILKDVQAQGGSISVLRQDVRLTSMAVGQLAASSHCTPFIPLSASNTMLDVMLLIGKLGVHRLPVVSDDGEQIVSVITQSAVMEYLVKHEAAVKTLTCKTLAELGLNHAGTVHAVKGDDTLQKAIELLRDHRVSALPVLGHGGAVIGNISARDLRNLILDSRLFALLNQPVRYFIAATSEVDHEAMNPAITCRAGDTLSRIMRQLCASKVHRTYLCNDHGQPIRVVSFSDILTLFVSEPEGYLASAFKVAKPAA